MNTGIQDAANLAWKVALVWKQAAVPVLLETYQEGRRNGLPHLRHHRHVRTPTLAWERDVRLSGHTSSGRSSGWNVRLSGSERVLRADR